MLALVCNTCLAAQDVCSLVVQEVQPGGAPVSGVAVVVPFCGITS
jgi:hypothetical protein